MRLPSPLTDLRRLLVSLARRVRDPGAVRRPLSPLVAAVPLVLGAACDAFDSERRPYTPFPVASGTPSPPPASDPAPLASPTPDAVVSGHEVLTAPPSTHIWRVSERALEAPDGLIFRLAMVGGLETGGARDVLAWLVGTPEKPVIGELWLYPEEGPPRLVAAAPGYLPTGSGCKHGALLSKTGPSSITLDISASCSGPLLPRAPVRSVAVLAPLREQAHIVGFQLAAAAPDETMNVEIVSADRDADGRDDVEMTLRLRAPDSSDVRARFVWLDRPAGLSRDAAEPRASFTELAKLEAVRASSQKSSMEVASNVASARRLYASLCAEAGVPRVFLDSGEGLDCGELEEPFQALTGAAIEAALNLGQIGQAFGALERHAWFPAGQKVTANAFVKKRLDALMARVNKRRVVKLVPLKARPRGLDPSPHFSPLSFHADGSLLMLTSEGLVRAAPDGRYEYEASDEVDPWATTLLSPSGERLTGVAFPCDRSEVSWLRTAADGAPLPPLRTTLIAPRPGNCVPALGFSAPEPRPLGWSSSGISAYLGATLLGSLPAHPPMGSAASPNGRFSVVVTDFGLLVISTDKTALWTFDDPGLPRQLHDCVISNNAQAAACLLTGNAYVILPDPKSG